METQEKFDDIIRSKFSEREIPFDEANWENIKKMTDAAREKKKRRRWGIIFLVGLICGAGITIPFIMKDTDTKNMLTENKTKQIETGTKENKQTTLTQTTYEKQQEKSNSVLSSQNTGNEEPVKTAPVENQTVENKKGVVSANEKTETTKGENSITANTAINKKEKNEPVVIMEKKQKEKKKSKNKDEENNTVTKTVTANPIVIKKEKSEPVVSTAIPKKEKIKPVVKNENKNENASFSNTSKKEAEAIVTYPSEKKGEDKTQEVVPAVNNSVTATENPKSVSDTTKTSANAVTENVSPAVTDTAKKDIVAVVVSTKDTTGKKTDSTEKINTWAFSVVGGLNSNLEHYCPIGGIEITKSILNRWKIGAGLYYTYYLTPTDKTTARTFTTNNYDFGVTSYNTNITVDKLHYAILNIFTEFNINKKNSLVGGANLFYLCNVDNTITTSGYSMSGDPIPGKIQKTHGYSTGLSSYDVGIMGGYRRKLFGRLDAGLYINIGLFGMIQKNYIRNTADGYFPYQLSTSSFQFVLKYNLFKK